MISTKEISRTLADVPHAALTAIGDEVVLGGEYSKLVFEVQNGHDVRAFQDFELQVQVHPSGTFVPFITSTAWATIANILTYKTADLNTLGVGVEAIAIVNIEGAHSIKFLARSADAGTARLCNIYGYAVL